VYFEMDIAWFVAGGADPYEYVREHGWWRFPRRTPSNVVQPNRSCWLTDVGKGDT
jgi:hypothetical protein